MWRPILVWAVVLSSNVWAGHPLTDGLALRAYEAQLGPDGNPAVTTLLKADFALLKDRNLVPQDAILLVRDTAVLGETFTGRVIVVSDKLALYRQELRLFVLAHEGSHASHDDNENRRTYIESKVSPFADRDTRASQYRFLEASLQKQAYEAELRADKEAVSALRALGLNGKQVAVDFFGLFHKANTDWHPASKARITAVKKS